MNNAKFKAPRSVPCKQPSCSVRSSCVTAKSYFCGGGHAPGTVLSQSIRRALATVQKSRVVIFRATGVREHREYKVA